MRVRACVHCACTRSNRAVEPMYFRARMPWPVMSIVYERSGLYVSAARWLGSLSKIVTETSLRLASASASTRPAGPAPTIPTRICSGTIPTRISLSPIVGAELFEFSTGYVRIL